MRGVGADGAGPVLLHSWTVASWPRNNVGLPRDRAFDYHKIARLRPGGLASA